MFVGPGAFVGLNADDIQQEVEGMWRTLYKLSKTFADQPGPRRVADLVRTKIEKFKQHMPVLHTICNPGLRERHWRQVCNDTTKIYILRRPREKLDNLTYRSAKLLEWKSKWKMMQHWP